MRILGIDYGEARTGLAICDRGETIATPLPQIHEKNFEACAEKVAAAARENRAEMLVVGLPRHMNGDEGDRAILSREFADLLHQLTGLEVHMWDERGTTKTAIYFMNETDTRGKKRKNNLDSAAASIILQGFIDSRRFSGLN